MRIQGTSSDVRIARTGSLDALRVVAAFAVVWLHVSAAVVTTDANIHSSVWWTGNLSNAFSRWCVPAFVMISGALLLSATSAHGPREFYRRRLSRLLPPLVLWTLAYVLLRALTESGYGLVDAVRSIAKGKPYYHLWYLYMLLGLYFVTPFLQSIVRTTTPRTLLLLIGSCFVVASIEGALGQPGATFLPSFLPFLGYFLAGHYIRERLPSLKAWYLMASIAVCGTVLALATGVLYPMIGERSWYLMYDYLNPVVILMSLSVFVLFTHDAIGAGLLQKAAPLTLGIYVIHPLWMLALSQLGIDGYWFHPLVGIPGTTLLVFALSAASASLLARIPLLRPTIC